MRKLRIVLSVALAAGLVCGLAGILRQQLDYRGGTAEYESAREVAGLQTAAPAENEAHSERGESQAPDAAPADPEQGETDPGSEAPEEAGIDLSALREINPDVVGWISIPGIDLSYPLLQTSDNEYYLKHTWTRESNSVGAIFLDWRSDAAFGDFNTLIYGHRMRDGSMFAVLNGYEQQSFWEQAPVIEITDGAGTHQYRIFAAYQAKTDADLYRAGEDSRDCAEAILQYAGEHSVLDTGIVPTGTDRILTLVTCTGNGHSARWVVQAVLTESSAGS